jgi:hypothetical protein
MRKYPWSLRAFSGWRSAMPALPEFLSSKFRMTVPNWRFDGTSGRELIGAGLQRLEELIVELKWPLLTR